MQISPFFRNLRNAYQSEIDDMSFDSDGKNVLQQRLAQRRGEMEFLVNMIELSPEMVAVVFHQGMRFTSNAVLEHLVAQDSDELPEWDVIANSVTLAPWAQALAQKVVKQPLGEWFLTLAAALEYLYHRHDGSMDVQAGDEDDEHDEDGDAEPQNEGPGIPMDSDAVIEAVSRKAIEEAGAEWMAAQGFERKE
jgi:hypothetical protein